LRRDSRGEIVGALQYDLNRDAVAISSGNGRLELGFKLWTDDEDEATESGPQRVVDPVIHQGLPGGANRLQLFRAAVATAEPGGEEEEGGAIGHVVVGVGRHSTVAE
jgi:hypothetical protein